MGTRESLPPPREIAANTGLPGKETTQVKRADASARGTLRTKMRRKVVSAAETKRGSEKGEGSLSIPIVPLESREIRPRKAGE